MRTMPRISDEIEAWLQGEGDRTLGGLVEVFGKRAFAVVFVLLLGVPALPVPTGGATHVFEVIAILVALQLVAGREHVWLPRRWRTRPIAPDGRFLRTFLKVVRRLERLSRPRLRFVFGHRLSNLIFGLLVVGGTLGAFLAPPFTGLDTLPSLAVVLVSLGVLLEDFLFVAAGVAVGSGGVFLEIVLGSAALNGIKSLF